MDKIKAILREEFKAEDERTVQIYDVGHYEVTVTSRRDAKTPALIEVYTHRGAPKYLPNLYTFRTVPSSLDTPWEVTVSTKSHGDLNLNEIRLLMEAMETGVATARYIQKKFVDPINNGTWNWDAAEKDSSENPEALVEVSDGETFCGNCGAEISCNEYGDMPDFCPNCNAALDYSQID